MEEPEVEYRLSSLETVLAEFIMQTNRSLHRLERSHERTEEFIRQNDQRREQERLAREAKAEAERLTREAKAEEERLAREAKAEAERLAREAKAEAERLTREAVYAAAREQEKQEQQAREARLEEERLTREAAYAAAREQEKQEQQAREATYAAMIRDMNKKWGEISEKLGTFAEDIAYPNTKRIANEQFGYTTEPDFEGQRVRRTNALDRSKSFEFDGLLAYSDAVFLVESKFSVRMKYLEGIPRLIENFRLVFPEFNDRKIIPVFTSMSIQPDQVKYLTSIGVYAMALGDRNMELLNFAELSQKNQ